MLIAALFAEEKSYKLTKYQLQTTEIPRKPFAKVSVDLTVELPVSHSGNKNILLMTDHLTGWPIATDIPDKEATTVANAIYKDLIISPWLPRNITLR